MDNRNMAVKDMHDFIGFFLQKDNTRTRIYFFF